MQLEKEEFCKELQECVSFQNLGRLKKKSGIRCFSSKAVAEIVKTKKSSVKEFQLEEFLNRLFTHHTVRVNTNLIFNVPWRSSTAKRFQGRKSTARIPKNVKIRVIPRHR